jgi:2-polyprenyl-3-methyl-5-hydroxy-6-metoxy-1,4-benzoquinol methylase
VIACRLCGAATQRLFGRSDVTLFSCDACGLVSGAVVDQSVSSDLDRDEYYRDYYRGPEAPAPLVRYAEWLAKAERLVGPGRRFLDVGAGRGDLVRVALERGWTADATEVSQSGLEVLRKTGARVFAGDLERACYDAGRFDFVAAIEVLEHVGAPAAFLGELARVTRPSGLILITTPNLKGISARLLGAHWRVVDSEHLCYFGPKVLRDAVLAAGFREAKVSTRSLDVAGWRAFRWRDATARFDPVQSAALRDRVEATPWLRLARGTANAILGRFGLGDSITLWARR